MVEKWREYYSAVFNTYADKISSEVGKVDCVNEIKKEFCDLMYDFNKYDLPYNEKVLTLKLATFYSTVVNSSNIEKLEEISRNIIADCMSRVEFNGVKHPFTK